jgi:hypothetical protein
VKTPCEEDRLANLMEVRQSQPVERHTCLVARFYRILKRRSADRGVGCGPRGPPHQFVHTGCFGCGIQSPTEGAEQLLPGL